MCIRNLEGPFRSPNCSSYVGMTLSTVKVAASWGPNDSSSPGFVSQQLDVPHIINYEPFRGFIVPKFTTCDRTSDPFDHIMHFR